MGSVAIDLRRAIIVSGLTHYAIGKAAGVAPAVIDRFVSGERDLRMATASKIADALGYGLMKKLDTEAPSRPVKRTRK